MDSKSIVLLILLILAMIAVVILAYRVMMRGLFKKDKREKN